MGSTTTETQEYSFGVGSIDLRGLCSCGSPCTTCCGHDCGACTGLPDTLTATVTSTGAGCACALGLTATLVWDGISEWVGDLDTTTACGIGAGDPIHLHLYCNAGAFNLDFKDQADPAACLNTNHVGVTTSSTTCSPLNLVFNSTSILSCCSSALGANIVITVTT